MFIALEPFNLILIRYLWRFAMFFDDDASAMLTQVFVWHIAGTTEPANIADLRVAVNRWEPVTHGLAFGVPTKNLDKVITDTLSVRCRRLVERNNVVDVIAVAEDRPQLHCDLGRKAHEILSKIINLFF